MCKKFNEVALKRFYFLALSKSVVVLFIYCYFSIFGIGILELVFVIGLELM